jgi:hypothetical protein
MDRDGVFERLFGHCAHQAVKVETAVNALLGMADRVSDEQCAAANVATMRYPRLVKVMDAAPGAAEMIRRYAGHPPSRAVRDAAEEFLELTSPMQQAILALTFQSMVRWRAFLRLLEMDPGIDCSNIEDPRFLKGVAAFQCLLGFDCMVTARTSNEVMQSVDKFVTTVMGDDPLDEMTECPEEEDEAGPPSAYIISAGPDLTEVAEAAWKYEDLVAKGQLFITLDLATGAESFARNEMGEILKAWAGGLAVSSRPDRYRLLHRAMIAKAVELHPWRAPDSPGTPISDAPPSDAVWRRCTRVLSLVHELHKAGYQRIRILPFLSGSGYYWRGWITYAGNVQPDGFNLIDWDDEDRGVMVAKYTSGARNEYFGWTDAKTLGARQLAKLFIERFPRIAEAGRGCDWAYAGWLTDVLGFAELGPGRGGLVNLINHDCPMDPEYLARWQPPPPVNTGL